ncbi:MAG: PAS domain S-box protein [Thermodesulfobacteriota bacterium]
MPATNHGSLNHSSELAQELTAWRAMAETDSHRFQRIVEEANEAIMVIQDGMIRFFNHKALAITGYTARDYLETPFHAFIHPDDRQMVLRRYQQRLAGEDAPVNYQFRIIAANGSTLWLQINAQRIEWDGRPAILAFLPDVSQMHRTERALRESQILLQMITENTRDMIILSLGLGRTVFVNSALESLLGYSHDEVTSIPLRELVHPAHLQTVRNLWKRARAGRPAPPQEILLLCRQGLPFAVEMSCFAIERGNREIYMGAIMRDITTRKQAEQELEQYRDHLEKLVGERTYELTRANAKLQQTIIDQEMAEENLSQEKNKLEAVFSAIGDGLTVLDRDHRILFQNAVLSERYGDCTGRLCYDAYHQRQQPCPECQLHLCLADGTVCRFETVSARNRERTYYELSIGPVRDSKGGIIAAVEVVREVTEQKQLAEQLLQAQKMEAIGTLAGGIAHDFNNILTAILGYAELSRCAVEHGSELHGNLNEIVNASRRAGELIRQILTFSRKSEFKKQPVQIQPVVKEAIKLLRGTIPSTITVRQEIGSECGTIMADITQIHQVLMNLSTNAYHAMRQEGGLLSIGLGNITLHASLDGIAPGEYVRLTVADTGHGMDKATLARIFEPYFSTKQQGEGTGLGLATVHGIVENHGGGITVQSTPGKGTTFEVYFPRIAAPAMPTRIGEEPARLDIAARILFVDDEEMLTRLGHSVLTKIGFTVTACNDGLHAFETFRRKPDSFDLLVTDQMMPGITGLELARQCRQLRPELPVILATGYGESIGDETSRRGLVDEVLLKPLSINTLAEAIQRTVAKQTG